MKIGRSSLLILVMALLIVLAGCVPAKEFTVGTFDGVTYTNDYFGLSFDMPEGWQHDTKEGIASALQLSADLLNLDEKELENQQSAPLAYITKHPYGYNGFSANMNINCIKIKLSELLAIRNCSGLLQVSIEQAEKMTEGTDLTYTFGEIRSETLGGADFAVVDATLDMNGYQVNQRILCTLQKKYAILMSFSWQDDSDLDEIQGMINTIRFK